jgi:CubicO group peptidase (beta-lactamase class C family)
MVPEDIRTLRTTGTTRIVSACIALGLSSLGVEGNADTLSIRPAVELRFDSVQGAGYQIQTSSDLAQWSDLGNAIVASVGHVSRLIPAGDDTNRYFRLETGFVRDLNPDLTSIRTQFNVPALACAVIISNRVVGVGVVGVRKYGITEPATINDKWHHGSLTKSMTATLAGIMVEENRLSWTSTVAEVFPEYSAAMNSAWTTVTLEQLLSHRSGAPGDLGPSGIWTQLWNHQGTPREQRLFLVQRVTALAPNSMPGTTYEYSNAGYAIAGAMMEKLAGKSWEDLITEKLFIPLGMTSAGFGVPATPRHIDHPWGHTLNGNVPSPVAPGTDADNPPGIGPGGTVHCTLLDMARYCAFHVAGDRGEGRLLQPATFQKLHADVANQGYALGWGVTQRPWGGGKVLQHTGSNLQWYTNVWLAPNVSFAVVILTNIAGTPGASATDAVAGRMIQLFL